VESTRSLAGYGSIRARLFQSWKLELCRRDIHACANARTFEHVVDGFRNGNSDSKVSPQTRETRLILLLAASMSAIFSNYKPELVR
jgi:hypothetical protein